MELTEDKFLMSLSTFPLPIECNTYLYLMCVQNPALRTLDPDHESDLKQFLKEGKKKEEFRNYEELKSVFDEMNMTVETDIEIMNKLFSMFALPSPDVDDAILESDVINYLKDFEYLVSQIDNARHFVHHNG